MSAEFGSLSAAESACHDLIGRGVGAERIRIVAHVEADPVAGEAPGQPYANQPGQHDSPPGDASRSHATCSVTVDATSPREVRRITDVLQKHGARLAC